jgi:hypothetical protein
MFPFNQQEHVERHGDVNHKLGDQREYGLLRDFDPTPVWVGELARLNDDNDLDGEKNGEGEDRDERTSQPLQTGFSPLLGGRGGVAVGGGNV